MNRNFNNRLKNEVIVSDLTYVQVNGKWNYICLLIDLFNREIIGHSVGTRKDALLIVLVTLKTVNIEDSVIQFFNMCYFHKKQFKNKVKEIKNEYKKSLNKYKKNNGVKWTYKT